MNKPRSNFNLRRLAPLALLVLIAALAIPGAALAQDPAGDQYAPTEPTGGGTTTPPDDGNPAPDPVPTSGADGAGGGDTAPGDPTSPTTGSPSGDPAGTSTGATAPPIVDQSGNKAQRTLDKIAAEAEQTRDAAVATDSGSRPTAELLRSDAGTGGGTGILLWIVIGLTLLWAVASGVVNFRRRDGGHHEGGQPA